MSAGYCDEEMHTFLATGLTGGQPHPESDESIEVVAVPMDSIPELIQRGEIKDAKSIAALLLALERKKTPS